ncbi:MAG: polysaccharide deacetylase family protein [Chloroflexota bacterium]
MTSKLRTLFRRTGLRQSQLAVRMCCERNVLAVATRFGIGSHARTTGRILCYHAVGQPLWGVNNITPERFRRHLDLALAAGYRFVPASELARTGGAPNELAITFDDGLKSVLTTAAPILADYGVPWSLFVVSDWVDGHHFWADRTDDVLLTWDDVERLAAAGADVGSHSVTHARFGTLDLDQMIDELELSRETIEARIGIRTSSFAIPFGQSGDWPAAAQAAAQAAGYTEIYAQAEETRPPGTVARTFVTRFDGDQIFQAALAGAFDYWEEAG